ncbi:MAG: hypothetical protein K0R54_99 [Clostridiaceae bacterium]|jgi:hypothetical protein|nr:hypothetical protein [Clostridiaceae bacterium]
MNTVKSDTLSKVKMFLNKDNVYKQLKTMVSYLIPDKSDVKLTLNIGGGSYTDGKSITVGVPTVFAEMENEKIFTALRALIGHESQHINSSDMKIFGDFIKEISDYLNKKYKIHPAYGKKVAKHVFNSVEDGRIEKILCNKLPGYLRYIKFLNGTLWEKQEINGNSELGDFLFTITTLSVTGLYPKKYNEFYKGTKLDDNIKKIENLIIDGINAISCKTCANICREIIKEVEEYLSKLLIHQSKEDEQFIQNIPDNMEFTTSEEKEQNSSGSQGISTHFKPEKKKENKKEEDNENSGQGESENEEISDEENENNSGDNGDEENEQETAGKGSDDELEENDNSEEESDDNSDNGSNSDNEEEDDEDNENSSSTKGSDDNSDDKENEDENSDSSDNSNSESSDNEDTKEDSSNDGDDGNNEMSDEDAVNEQMKEIEDKVVNEAKEKLKEDKESSSKKKKENEGKLSQEDIKELENEYKDERIRDFNEIKGFPTNHQLPSDLKRDGNKFRKEVERIFKNKEIVNQKNLKKGLLDTGEIWRVGIKDYNVFAKNGTPDKSDFVAYILQDGSGSMREIANRGSVKVTKQEYSAGACAIIEEGLKGIIPFKISTFSTNSGYVIHNVIKDFNENTSNKNLSWNFLKHKPANGGNKDGYSIRVATKELENRSEKDKILIILSDGLPSDYNRGYDEGMIDVKEAVKEARKKGIYVVALMFGSKDFRDAYIDNYKNMYEKNIVSCDPDKITNQLIRVLRGVISR